MGMKWPSDSSQVGRKQKPSLMPREALPLTNPHPQNIRVRDSVRDSVTNLFFGNLRIVENTGSGGRIRTFELRVMRATTVGHKNVKECCRRKV